VDRTKITVPADVLEGLEAVRRSGKTNLFDVPVVVQLALEMGFPDAAFWVEEHKSLYFSGIIKGFEGEGGEAECVDR
jgi:hypothetical protein